ncbi:MAG: DUF2946 domain-containing protein [Pseudomonas sp.]|nr:DUF2946 domain-containing protein [Pseudomonas sp.]
MTPTRPRRVHVALMLYFCIMLAAFQCSMGHGEAAGLALQGLGIPFCGAETGSGLADLSSDHAAVKLTTASFDCSVVSAFVALALAAFFGLLFWLVLRRRHFRGYLCSISNPCRALWPPANPRAPPLFA